jgi:L-seryl-tRNA(Ser) seleniumtransferase
VRIQYAAGRSSHKLHLTQQGNRLEGIHQGDFVSRDISGTVQGDSVRMRSSYTEQHGDSLQFTFAGKISGDEMSGTLDMGEYLGAKWTAVRHQYRAR